MAFYVLFIPFLFSVTQNTQLAISGHCLINSEESVVWSLEVDENNASQSISEIKDYKVELESAGQLKVYTPTHVIVGNWKYIDAALQLHIPEDEPASVIINHSWYIDRPYLNEVRLTCTSEDLMLTLLLEEEAAGNML